MSIELSVSAATSDSDVWKKIFVPSAEAPLWFAATAPFPPPGPVDWSSVRLWFANADPVDAIRASDASEAAIQMRATRLPKAQTPSDDVRPGESNQNS